MLRTKREGAFLGDNVPEADRDKRSPSKLFLYSGRGGIYLLYENEGKEETRNERTKEFHKDMRHDDAQDDDVRLRRISSGKARRLDARCCSNRTGIPDFFGGSRFFWLERLEQKSERSVVLVMKSGRNRYGSP